MYNGRIFKRLAAVIIKKWDAMAQVSQGHTYKGIHYHVVNFSTFKLFTLLNHLAYRHYIPAVCCYVTDIRDRLDVG